MNNIEIVVETYGDFITYEQWLFGNTFPEKVNVDIFCRAESKTYSYTTVLIGSKWLIVTTD